MFRIKICGVTNAEDAAMIAAAGADAIGLNFYAQSSRCIGIEKAADIVTAAGPAVRKIGLFVNESVEKIQAIHSQLRLDAIQLHGDESPEFISQLAGLPIVKAFRLAAGGEASIEAFVAACGVQGAPLAAVIIDAHQPGTYGGTGQTADWNAAARLSRRLAVPMILAGGLTAENVARAIALVRPYGVDTASGVESSPGAKDAAMVSAFVSSAREALA